MIYVFLANGFEEIEAVTVIDILRRAGLDVASVSIEEGVTVQGAHGIRLQADRLFSAEPLADKGFAASSFANAQAMVLPGGGGYKRLAAHEGLGQLLQGAARDGVLLAAICAAPAVLAGLGLLKGVSATIYPGMEDELEAGGAIAYNAVVARDKNVITSRSPGTAMGFALEIAKTLSGGAAARKVAASLHRDGADKGLE